MVRTPRDPRPPRRSTSGLTVDKDADMRVDRNSASKHISKAAKEWQAAKKRERAARNDLAKLVVAAVKAGLLTENKISNMTDIPRMTIRKMLGKDGKERRSQD